MVHGLWFKMFEVCERLVALPMIALTYPFSPRPLPLPLRSLRETILSNIKKLREHVPEF